MHNNEIRYASITRNQHVTEFRWKPYLKTGIQICKIAFVWLFRQFRSTEITRNYVTFCFVFETGYYT
jgi:hypothetical protein